MGDTPPAPNALPPTALPPTARPWWRGVLTVLVKVAVGAVVAYLVLSFVRSIDWAQVGDALGRLQWWESLVTVLLVAIRQTANASPLVFLLPGLGLPHAVSNGLSGTLIATFTPPPSDIVLRMSMLTSWGIEPTRGAAALVLNTVVFYLDRFAAPVLGLVLIAASLAVEPVYLWTALGGAVVAGAIIWVLSAIARGEQAAGRVGRSMGGLVRRIRRSIDPEDWAAAMVRFQNESSAGLAGRLGRAAPAMLAFIVIDGIVLIVSLRFVGIPGEHLGYVAVLAAFLCLYPLTIFPFAGLGVFDASLVVLVNADGAAYPADLLAALVVWRAATLLLPLLPGLGALTLWRRRQAKAARSDEDGAAPSLDGAANPVS